jgi:sugar phosphate permease
MNQRQVRRVALSRRTQILRWMPIGLFVFGMVKNFFDRLSLSIGNPEIRRDLGLNIAEMGILLSAFSWTYAFAQLPAGLLADKVNPRFFLAGALFLWSLVQAGAGLVSSLGAFIVARMGLGLFEAPAAPISARIVSNWFERKKRGLPMGFANSGSSIGPILGPPILTWIMLGWGWRAMFVSMGVAGMVFAFVWFLLYRDPDRAGIPQEEQAALHGDDAERRKAVTLRQWARLFRLRVTWGMILGNFGQIYVIWLFLTWMPGYLEIERHVSILHAGFYTSIPPIFGMCGSMFGGFMCDHLAARGFRLLNSRKTPLICGLVGAAVFTLPVAFTDTTWIAIAWISAAVFCGGITSASVWVLVTAVAPEDYVGSLGSMQNFGGYLGASMAPIVTGFIVQATGSFAMAFVVGSLVAALAAVCYLLVVTHRIAEADLA